MKKVFDEKQKREIKQILCIALSPFFSILYTYCEHFFIKEPSQFALGCILFSVTFGPPISLLFALSLVKKSKHPASILTFCLSLLMTIGTIAVLMFTISTFASFDLRH